MARRTNEHAESGRLIEGAEMRPLDRDVTYGQARGYEQAYIEHYETKTGTRGESLSDVNTDKGNRIASFDHDNTTWDRDRQSYFEKFFNEKMNELEKGGKTNC
jgi:hypothetical protein